MWQPIRELVRKLNSWKFRRSIDRSLALHLRGEVRSDGLTLLALRNGLDIRWRARAIHPWDRDLSAEVQSALFQDQVLADTEAVIFRLFQSLPQIDVIDLTVVDVASDGVILEGRVYRSVLQSVRNLRSIRMRLQQLGVSYASPAGADGGHRG